MKIQSPLTVFSSMLTVVACSLMIYSTTAKSQYMPNKVIEEQRSGPPRLRQYELIIKNRSGNDITQVYAKSLSMNNFSVDLIPNYVIRDGRQGLVNLIDSNGSCEWRIRTVHENGYKAEKVLNVCQTATLTIN